MMRILPCGTNALLLEFDSHEQVLAWYTSLTGAELKGVLDVIPAARTMLVVVDPARTSLTRVKSEILKREPSHGVSPLDDHLVIPVTYDGEDLESVAAALGCRPSGVIAWHTTNQWRVAFCGFAPGFGYLLPLNGPQVNVPRRPTPRTKVPPGAVALAGPYTGIYPRSSPGGWQLLGRTSLEMFDPHRDPPTLLRPGARVTFVEQQT